VLPANRNDHTLRVRRSLDVDEDDLLDAVTSFALRQDLEIDHRHDGDGLLFRRRKESTPNVEHLLKRGDSLQVIITADAGGHDIEFAADLSGARQRKSEGRRGKAIRSGIVAALFGYFAVKGGLNNQLDLLDLIWVGISARFGVRAARLASSDPDLEHLERDVAAALNRVCDEAQFGPGAADD
jgi:hypothetical protein